MTDMPHIAENAIKHWKILQQQESIHIDELYFKSGLSSSSVATALLMLEMQNVIASLPGKVYKLC